MRIVCLLVSSALLGGCLPIGTFQITETGAADSFSVSIVADGTCGATGLQSLLSQNESALDGLSLPAGTRLIRPGSDYARDSDGSRLNIAIAADGTIVQVACG